MKHNFPTEDVVMGKPVTFEAFVALMIFGLPLVALGFAIYWLVGRRRRKEEKEFAEYMEQRKISREGDNARKSNN